MSADSSLCMPWAQTLIDEVMDVTKTSVTNWCNIVAKTGLSENLRQEWAGIFITQVTETYKEMIDEAVENQNKVINQIEILLKKSEVLCKDLHIRMPQYGSQKLSLYEEFQLLENRIDEYEKKVQAQKKEIGVLLKQQSEACKLLGLKEKVIPMSPLPTALYLEDFKRYLETLETTKFDRLETFLETKNDILMIVDELQYEPALDFEKLVLSTDDSFLITNDNMEKLEVFHTSLKELAQSAKVEVANLREVLENLWKILNIDLSVRDEFLAKNCGHSLNTLEALKSEIKRCEILKKANIQNFVEKLRLELVDLWEQCQVTNSERENFIYFRVDHFTEDLLTLHDYEIKRLQNYYKNNMQLFALIEKRKILWEKMLRLEEKETASDRYKNRGGQLLQEERERKTLTKQIPSMEEQMLQLASKYESDNGTPFLCWGETIQAIINRDHEEHNQNRKLKLSERKKIRDKTLITPKSNLGVTCSASTQNLALTTPRNTTTKRKLLVTPSCSTKRNRVLLETNARTAPAKLKIIDKFIQTPRFSTERAKRSAKRRRLSHKGLKKRDHASPASSEYYSFEREVDSKDGCRSTLAPDLLAVPLAITPQPTPSNQRSPRIISKLSVAPLKLLF